MAYYSEGVYYGNSTEEKPADVNEPAFWYNIDNEAEHKIYAYDVESKEWISQD